MSLIFILMLKTSANYPGNDLIFLLSELQYYNYIHCLFTHQGALPGHHQYPKKVRQLQQVLSSIAWQPQKKIGRQTNRHIHYEILVSEVVDLSYS